MTKNTVDASLRLAHSVLEKNSNKQIWRKPFYLKKTKENYILYLIVYKCFQIKFDSFISYILTHYSY